MSEAPPPPARRAISPLLILALGALLGRFASQLPDGTRGLVDLLIAALLAISITMMWRRWARRAMERRRQEQLDRKGRASRATKKS